MILAENYEIKREISQRTNIIQFPYSYLSKTQDLATYSSREHIVRAAVEKVALANSVITEFDSLTGRVTCNIEISTFQVRNLGKPDMFYRLHAKR